ELALEHDDDLLLLVDVGGSDRVGRERHEVGHRVLAEHRTERQPRDELDGVDVVDPDEATRPRGHTMGLAAEVAFTAAAGHPQPTCRRSRRGSGPGLPAHAGACFAGCSAAYPKFDVPRERTPNRQIRSLVTVGRLPRPRARSLLP